MALGLSTAAANALLDTGIQTTFDSGVLEIRSGTRPASADTLPTGTVLATIPIPADSFNAASGGTITKQGVWQDGSADATGTATWFRLQQAADLGTTNTTDERIDGDVAVSASDLNLTTTAIATADQITITQFDLNG